MIKFWPGFDKSRERLPQLLRTTATLVLLGWACHGLATLVWLLLPAPEFAATDPALALNQAALQRAASADERPLDTALLANLPFARNGADAAFAGSVAHATNAEGAAADTTLDLVLHGTVASSERSAARAIIAEGKRQMVVVPGAALPISASGVSLVEVLTDRVILDNNGRRETLWIDQPERASRPALASTRQASATVAGAVDNAMPAALAEVVAFALQRSDDGRTGLRLRAKGDGRLFRRLGLRNDDLVLAINDVSLQDREQAMALAQTLHTADAVRLQVRRNGKPLVLDLDLKVLEQRVN